MKLIVGNASSILGLAIGILGAVFLSIPVIRYPMIFTSAALGLVLSVIALICKPKGGYQGMAIAGLIIGIMSTALTTIAWIRNY